ncbi:methyltransferase domain-containing protein [Rhizophagus irregularis DAOM 181602=DAOM 197198]|nr:methyltransferase domain-containing protein [Rhizophagus irregularis DAOM 181602=DAOM 197198]
MDPAYLKTGACCTEEPIPANIEAIIKDIHPKVISRYYGCGSPFPPALEGKPVLDLGSGSGRDFIFLIIRIDLDMVIFKKGYIEDLQSIGIEDESIDVVVSNGSRIPESLVKDPILYGECLSGALYIEDFRRLITSLGYPDYRTIINRKVDIKDSDIKQKIGMIDFYSITIRTFKVPLEDRSEDYGQVAVYKGNIEDKFVLDNHHVFKINDQVPICGNTSAMLQKTRYADYFDIIGESVHYGLFKSSG